MKDSRRISDANNFRCGRQPGVKSKLIISVDGRNSAGQESSVALEIDWWMLPLLMRQIHAAWSREEIARIEEVKEINRIFPAIETIQ